MAEDEGELQPYWLMAVELDDVVPRRDPFKPNLFVGITQSPPDVRFEQMKRSSRKTWYFGHVQKLRLDLSPANEYADRESAKAALRQLREELLEQGYSVNRYTLVWQVYVLELDQSKSTDPKKKPVYVGETSTTTERRMQQHMGELLSKKGKPLTTKSTKGHAIRVMPELAPKEIYFSSAQSKRAEAEWAEHLRKLDYEVFGGH